MESQTVSFLTNKGRLTGRLFSRNNKTVWVLVGNEDRQTKEAQTKLIKRHLRKHDVQEVCE